MRLKDIRRAGIAAAIAITLTPSFSGAAAQSETLDPTEETKEALKALEPAITELVCAAPDWVATALPILKNGIDKTVEIMNTEITEMQEQLDSTIDESERTTLEFAISAQQTVLKYLKEFPELIQKGGETAKQQLEEACEYLEDGFQQENTPTLQEA